MKTKLKKLLSVALALCLLVGTYAVTAFAETPALTLNTPTNVIPADGYVYYTFTPAVTGEYLFVSEQVTECDPYIYGFVDAQGNQVDPVLGDDDDWNDYEFWAIYTLTADEEYTLTFYDYHETTDGFNVTVSKYLGVLQQPTSAKPTVKVSYANDVQGYQWYKAELDGTAVTDQNAEAYSSASYDSTTGSWTGAKTELAGEYGYNYFKIDLKAGEALTVVLTDAPTQYYLWGINSNSEGEAVVDGNTVTFTVPEDDSYELAIATLSDSTTIKAYIGKFVLSDKVEGQTTDTLTAYEKDVYYICQVTYKDGTVVTSAAFTVEPVIVKQPTVKDPTVKVTYPDEAAYQWYKTELVGTAVTDQNAKVYSSASYDSTTGSWTGAVFDLGNGEYGYSYFTVDLNAEDILTVISTDEPTQYYLWNVNTDFDVEGEVNGNTVTFTVPEDGTYEFGIATMSSATTIKAYIGELKLGDKVDGQNTATLTKYEKDTYYACVVTYSNDVALTSNSITFTQQFTHHPTAAEPYVTVTYPDDVKSYQWYEIKLGSAITDEDVTILSYGEDEIEYDSTTGIWTGIKYDLTEIGWVGYGYNYFEIDLKAGDALTVVSTDELTNRSYLSDFSNGLEAEMEMSGNTVTFTVEEDGTYMLGIATMSDSTTIKAYMGKIELSEKVDGETAAAINTVEKGTDYVCVVTYNDDTALTSNPFTATATTQIVAELDKYDTDTVTPADKADIQDKIDAIEKELENEDLTDAEKEALTAAKKDAEALMAAIEKAENAANAANKINALPATVTKNDEAAIKAAEQAYKALTDEEKALLSSDTVKKLNDALAALEELNKPADSGTVTDTGDNSNLTLWVVLLIASCAFILGTVVYSRKRQKIK